MFQKSFQNMNFDHKSISKDIKRRFLQVLQSLQLQMRVQNTNRQQQLQRIQKQVRLMTQKVNEFSNMLLDDNFLFSSLNDHPLLMIKYCILIFQILIKNHTISNNNPNQIISQTFNPITKNIKSIQSRQHNYNQNNIYQVMSAVKLQNYDLKQKVKQLNQQLLLAKKRANIAEEILEKIKNNTQKFMENYKINFTTMCDLLKKAESNQIQLLQNNRFLKEQLQSLTIQFDRYKQYFKQGPSLKDKEDKLRYQFQKQYEEKLKNTIKQVERNIKSQLQRSIVEKLNTNNGNLSIVSKNGRDIKIR